MDWSTGDSGSSTTVFSPGMYTVTVTAANGCTGSASANVTALPSPNPAIVQANYTCNGQLTLSAGSGFSSYSWSNSAGTIATTVNITGTYSVTVTNAQGCTGTDDFFATIPSPPVVSITGNNTFCGGSSADLSATDGFSIYAWSNGQSAQDISVSTGGNYLVTVTDAFGCTATTTFALNQLPSPQPTIVGQPSICAGTSTTFNTSNNFPAYSWSDGQATNAIMVSTAGIYTVTVTAANGCTGTDSQALNLIAAPAPVISQATYACDEQLTLSAGPGFSSYAWNNAISSATNTVTVSGNYEVTVTNAQGCTGTNAFFATIPTPPSVGISGDASICPGLTTTLIASTGFSMYTWSTAAVDPDILVSTAGNYAVTVTDAFGCTATEVFSVSQLAGPTTNISGPSQICSTGSATFSVPGTFSDYSWSNGATTPTIMVNAPAIYTVTVTAANGCTGTDSQNLVVANSLQPQITELPYACNSQITLDAGIGFNTYAWNGGQNTQSITVLANGDYSVTVSDVGGCTGTAVVTAAIPTAPTVSITGNNNICAGSATTLNATAGWTAYTWSNGQVGASISVNAAGPYSVTATDAFGCTVTDNFVLTTLPQPQPAITGPAVICINSSGTLALNTTFSQYNWSTGATTASINVLSENTYSVTVTDAQGCTGTDSQLVMVATGLSPTLTQLPYACNGAQTLDAGIGFTSYAWSGGQNTPTINVTVSGNYAVTVTDATGCTGTTELAVVVPIQPQVIISGTNSFCQNSQTTLEATAGFAAYDWGNGETTSTLVTNTGGNFTVTVTDNLGCTATATLLVTANSLPQPQLTGPAAVCPGSVANFTLGQNFAAYAWSDGSSGNSISTSTAGMYAVTVTDQNGCTGSANASLTIFPNPTATVQEQPYMCDGQIILSASSGFTAYSWSGPNAFSNNSQAPTLTTSGTYTVTATDANGCTTTAAQAVVVPAVTQVTLSGPNQFCTGGSLNLTAAANFATYAWSNGPTQADVVITTAGAYALTATDALGCTSTAALTVSNFPSPAPLIAGPQSVCPGNSATLSVAGNFASYSWSTGASTVSITEQPPLTATVTVTDTNGCTGTTSASVTVSNQLSPNIVQLPYACNQQISLDAGLGYSSYVWSTAAVTSTIQVTQGGTYVVTVSNGSGCSGVASIQVNVPVASVLTVSGSSYICPGQGSLLTASSGFSAYQWSDGQFGAVISASQFTTYQVSAVDALGCTATASFVLGQNPPLVPAITTLPYACDGQVSLVADAGPFSYIWSNGLNTQTITLVQSGNYTVTVTNSDGCSGTAVAQITIPVSVAPQLSSVPTLCPGASSTSSVTNHQNYAQFLWSTGATTFSITGVQGGQGYAVTVTDLEGCTQTAGFTVALAPVPSPNVVQQPYACNNQITLNAGGGFASYAWAGPGNFNAGSQQPTVSMAGLYTVTVTNNQACSGTASIQLSIPPAPSVGIAGMASFCAGDSTILTATAGFASYIWNNGSTGNSLVVSSAGVYTVTATNGAGCTATSTTTVQTGLPISTILQRKSCRLAEAGTQILPLSAANGCDSIVTIITTYDPTKPGLALDLTPVIAAQFGQEIELNITGNFQIDSVVFASPLALSCINCLQPRLTASASALILVTAFDADGCSTAGEIQLNVRRRLEIYVPNAFQPGSTTNSIFTIFSGPEIHAIHNFRIFDRWGNALFSLPDMPTNDPIVGWDGSFRGQAMQPGVYVYYFEVMLEDGSKEIYSGDISIVQ